MTIKILILTILGYFIARATRHMLRAIVRDVTAPLHETKEPLPHRARSDVEDAKWVDID